MGKHGIHHFQRVCTVFPHDSDCCLSRQAFYVVIAPKFTDREMVVPRIQDL